VNYQLVEIAREMGLDYPLMEPMANQTLRDWGPGGLAEQFLMAACGVAGIPGMSGSTSTSAAAMRGRQGGRGATGGRDPVLRGRAAEDAVGESIGIAPNRGPGRATVPGSGPGGFRIPDFDPSVTVTTRGAILEVKNLSNLSITPQLRDLIAEAKRLEVVLEIHTNANVPMSGELADAIEAGNVRLVRLP